MIRLKSVTSVSEVKYAVHGVINVCTVTPACVDTKDAITHI